MQPVAAEQATPTGSVGKIWLATAGEYSDFHVLGAFATKEDAEAAVALGYGEDVSECDMHPAGVMPVKTLTWYVRGNVERADEPLEVRSHVHWNLANPAAEFPHLDNLSVDPKARIYDATSPVRVAEVYAVWCWSLDRERAVKVVSDKLAQLRAEAMAL